MTARLYTIPATSPFLDTLAAAVLDGTLPEPGPPPEPRSLTEWTILLPTRRAARALREAFLRVSGARAMLLPRIRAIGDVDEDEVLLAPLAEGAGPSRLALELPPAVGELDRRLALTQLVLRWMRARPRRRLGGEAEGAGDRASPAQACALAGELARLMDAVDTERARLDRLDRLVPEDYAAHWQETLDFLKIVTEHWPRHLAEHGLMSPYARRDTLMAAACRQLAETPPAAPVIAAGSTGSVPATAELLKTIAGLARGAVVLPGLDLALDEAGWEAIADHPEHPQFGMKELLARIGAGREGVRILGGLRASEGARERTRLISEAMRPAADTGRWRAYAQTADAAAVRAALEEVALIEAATAQEEAEVVALALRHAAETPGRTAALVTPDRTLARRVAARLEEWGLSVDDSAGRPLAATAPGVFLELVADAVRTRFAPVPLMALLKHPHTRLGRRPASIRQAARLLELAAFRQTVPAEGLAGAREALAAARRTLSEGGPAHAALRRHGRRDWEQAQAVVDELEAAFAPLTALSGGRHRLRTLARAHIETAEALARDDHDRLPLWEGEAGEALALALAEMVVHDGPGPDIDADDYADLYRSLLAGRSVRPQAPRHPRLFIWGPLEARLQRPDLVILGGLNDGVWPRHEETDPWLSRPMRQAIGLPPVERRMGLSAHDFAQAMGAPRVMLTRAQKVDGVPTVPSRWLLRLKAVLDGLGLAPALAADAPWLHWARGRDRVPAHEPAPRPRPCPPHHARPRRLSVTRIEEWIANPYAVFARHILCLEPLEPLAGLPEPALRGQIVHHVLHRFVAAYPDRLPADIEAEIERLAEAAFSDAGAYARIRAFWQPQFVRFARWLAQTEPPRRQGVACVHGEVAGEVVLDMAGGPFTLTARADRIDLRQDGTLAIYDYKTGRPPSPAQVDRLEAPQLPLEAAIAAAGGFHGLPAASVTALRYIHVLGRSDQPGAESDAGKGEPPALAQEAMARLRRLIDRFDDDTVPYAALRRRRFARNYRYDRYAHLARLQEWTSGDNGGEEE